MSITQKPKNKKSEVDADNATFLPDPFGKEVPRRERKTPAGSFTNLTEYPANLIVPLPRPREGVDAGGDKFAREIYEDAATTLTISVHGTNKVLCVFDNEDLENSWWAKLP